MDHGAGAVDIHRASIALIADKLPSTFIATPEPLQHSRATRRTNRCFARFHCYPRRVSVSNQHKGLLVSRYAFLERPSDSCIHEKGGGEEWTAKEPKQDVTLWMMSNHAMAYDRRMCPNAKCCFASGSWEKVAEGTFCAPEGVNFAEDEFTV